MELEHEFTVPVPRAQAWAVLMDVERIAPCLPGATFDGYLDDADESAGFKGRVKVKLGPITVTYNGTAHFAQRDEDAGAAVIEAAGKEARGPGTASATIRAQLTDEGSATRVSVLTDLNVTGKPAQFGRGVMAEVGAKLVGQFADCLASQLGAGPGVAEASSEPAGLTAVAEPAAAETADASAGAAAPSQRPRLVEEPRPTADTIDLLDHATVPVLKRVLPVLAGLVALVLLWRLLRRPR